MSCTNTLESEAKQQAIITCTQASWVPDYVLKCILRVSWWSNGKEPTQGTWVWSLVQEDSTCCGATKNHKRQLLSLWSSLEPQLPKPTCPRICALQQERPPRWQARALRLEINSPLAATRESLRAAMKTQSSQKKKKKKAPSLLLRISQSGGQNTA